jgi:hypothetical protein
VMAIRALMQNGIKIVKAPVFCGRGAAYLRTPTTSPPHGRRQAHQPRGAARRCPCRVLLESAGALAAFTVESIHMTAKVHFEGVTMGVPLTGRSPTQKRPSPISQRGPWGNKLRKELPTPASPTSTSVRGQTPWSCRISGAPTWTERVPARAGRTSPGRLQGSAGS